MMDSPVSRQGSGRCSTHDWEVALILLFVAACGLKAHPGSLDKGGQPSGIGGQAVGSGGQPTASGGQPTASGGQSTASGGQSTASGGQSTASGGQSTDTGGQSTGTGGQSTGTGGQSTGVGGMIGTGGKTSGAGGASVGGSGSGGSSSTGAGVTINGKFVPKEKAVVFIHFGHSNMRGQASAPTSLTPYFYTPEDGLWSYKGSFSPAKEPTAPEGSITLAGPGMAILHSARGAVASSSDVQFISIGYGIGSKTTVDYQKSGLYYPIFMGWAGKLKGNVTFGAIIIMLGLTDAEHLASNLVPGFPTRTAQIISDIRADLGEPNLPVLFCDYEMGATGTFVPTGAIGKAMIPLIHQLPSLISNLVLVPTDSLAMQDDHHFNMQGHKDWAGRVISLMQSNNWFPWK